MVDEYEDPLDETYKGDDAEEDSIEAPDDPSLRQSAEAAARLSSSSSGAAAGRATGVVPWAQHDQHDLLTTPQRRQPVSRLRFETPLQTPAANGHHAHPAAHQDDAGIPQSSSATHSGATSSPRFGSSSAERLAKAYSPGVRKGDRPSVRRTPSDDLILPVPRITVSDNTPGSTYSPSLGTPRRAWDQGNASPLLASPRAPVGQTTQCVRPCALPPAELIYICARVCMCVYACVRACVCVCMCVCVM
jgi:hypothetical protein